jgi:glycerate kinase
MTPTRLPVLVAPDAFKGSLRAIEVARAVASGLESGGWVCDIAPLADGGEGTCDVLVARLGGRVEAATAHDPLGREIEAEFGLLDDGRAVVEVAAASGLDLVAVAERDAEAASSAGTGELIVAAIAAGARHVLVGAGGSATTDGGAGAVEAIERAGGIGEARLSVLCDVRTPFERAAEVFAPQKGADANAVARLRLRLDAMSGTLRRDPRGVAMTGAGGGLAGGLWACFDAALLPGALFVLDAIAFDRRLRASHAVVLGEGRLDATTLQGKALAEAATRARQLGIPSHAIVAINALEAFDQRILDLQTIREATTKRELTKAAAQLATSL